MVRIGRRLAALLVALALAALPVLLAARHARFADRATREPRTHVTAAMRASAERDMGPIEDVALRTSDGLTLRGWYAPSRRRAAVILVHGGSRNRVSMLPEAALLASHGFGVLVYDSRACGESDGAVDTWGDGEQADLVAALDYVSARPDVDPTRIGVQGISIGGSTVALVAARDQRAAAVLLNATWTTFEEEIASKFGKYGPLSLVPAMWAFRRAGVRAEAIRPVDHVAEIAPRPLLLITGDRDTDTPVEVGRRLFDAAREPKEMWVVEGAKHGGYMDVAPAEYGRRVLAFFERALSPR